MEELADSLLSEADTPSLGTPASLLAGAPAPSPDLWTPRIEVDDDDSVSQILSVYAPLGGKSKTPASDDEARAMLTPLTRGPPPSDLSKTRPAPTVIAETALRTGRRPLGAGRALLIGVASCLIVVALLHAGPSSRTVPARGASVAPERLDGVTRGGSSALRTEAPPPLNDPSTGVERARGTVPRRDDDEDFVRVLFEPEALRPSSLTPLDNDALRALAQCPSGVAIVGRAGHAGDRSSSERRQLARQRAGSLRRTLEALGVLPQQLHIEIDLEVARAEVVLRCRD